MPNEQTDPNQRKLLIGVAFGVAIGMSIGAALSRKSKK